jgi:hypothetical protein
MAVEQWIDEIAKLWEFSDGKGATVKSFRAYERGNFPETIGPFPCALTYTTEDVSDYSVGGPNIDLWNGITEFHLVADIGKHHYPYIMLFFKRIRDAVAGHIQLSGLVENFLLRKDVPSIQGPVVLQYGQEAPHLGLIVNWEAKENVTGDFVVAA